MIPSVYMNKGKLITFLFNYNFIGVFNQPQIRKFSALHSEGEPRFLDQVRLFLSRAASQVDIDPDYYQLIESCSSVIRFNIPLRRDNGDIQTVACYRA